MTRKPRTESEADKQQRLANLKSHSASDTSGGTVSLPSRVPPELKQWVITHSQLTGKSASQIVREAVELYRQTNNHEHEHKQTHPAKGTGGTTARDGEGGEAGGG